MSKRINISVSDELYALLQEHEMNISRICQHALRAALTSAYKRIADARERALIEQIEQHIE